MNLKKMLALVTAMVIMGLQTTQAEDAPATGGTITQDGSVWIHTFTSSGTFAITDPAGIKNVEILVVGGGGAGGGANGTAAAGGGGGGGDFVTNSFASLSAQNITVTVGAGGIGGASVGGKGGNSSFAVSLPSTNMIALGGGGGGFRSGSASSFPTTGGSSGGAGYAKTSPAGTGLNVNKGGDCGNTRGGCGGGGAYMVGSNINTSFPDNGTAGGEGLTWYGVVYASGGGGGGACDDTHKGSGGGGGTNAADGPSGLDGVSKNGNAAPANFGGGGSGSTGSSSGSRSGGVGGSGIVVVRYVVTAANEAGTLFMFLSE